MDRECPRCHVTLEEREHEIPGFNVKADHCPECQGIFLDKNELKKLTGQRNINQLITEYLGVDVGSELLCPSCGGLMDDEHFEGEAAKITIDVCTTCHGVWLDDGELDALAALDDKSFDKLSPEKRAEVLDQDLARSRGMRGKNIFVQVFANFAHGLRMGTRKLR